MSKTAVQVGIIAVCLAVLPVIVIRQQQERAAKLKRAQAEMERRTAEQQKTAEAAATTTVNATAGSAPAGKPAEPKLGPRDEKAIQLQKANLSREWGRDPFHAVGTTGPTAKAGALTLKGIAYRPEGKSFVMVNEAILREGEEIEGNRIIKIERRQITLSHDGREFILRLEKETP